MEKEAFNALLKKYEDGQCTPEEIAYVENWFLKFAEDSPSLAAQPDYDAIDAELRTRLGLPPNAVGPQSKAYSMRVVFRYVAAMLVFSAIGFGIYWYTNDKEPKQQLTSQYGDDVLPGGDRAILTLADGHKIDLDSATDGLLVQLSGIRVTKGQDGTLTYEVQSDGGVDDTAPMAFNTITTPRGGQYRVNLADGTKVWLNAESSITYPLSFQEQVRKVEMTGEVYFEVTHRESQPFIVSMDEQSIEVLGTQFNVNAYGDESEYITTLVNGRIRLSTNNGNPNVTLTPGQQAVFNKKLFEVQEVNAHDYAAWKDGLIVLSEADLPTIARQLERWYDVDFDIEDLPTGHSLNGEVPRNTNLSGILHILELNTGMKFKIEGRRITTEKE